MPIWLYYLGFATYLNLMKYVFFMRNEVIKKYVEKYSLGVVEIKNSLEQYNSFFKNMGFKEPIEKLIEERLKNKKVVKILDVGCGNAGFLAELNDLFGEKIHTIGVDLLAPEKPINEVILGDAVEVNFPKDVDFVFSFRTLHEIGEPEKIIKKIYSSLAKEGKAFLSFRTMDLYAGGKGIAELKAKEIKKLRKMVELGKLKEFNVSGFEVSIKDEKGNTHVAGVNVFLEK